jgi:release factor glutamine methyltransferase
MTIRELKSKFISGLTQLYPATEIHSFFKLLIDYKLGLTTIDIALKPTIELSKDELEYFLNALIELKQEKPIQYIIGETEFYGLIFKVNEDTLIPRPETEELVHWILKEEKINKLNILDIGTGTGCIAISLAKNLDNSKVNALDISKKALIIAKQNASLNMVDINFIEGDILDKNIDSQFNLDPNNFDIIVSNPPYVREKEKQEIKNNVLDNEPHLALFVKDNDPLIFYDKIADFALKNLSKKGKLYLEINQYLSSETIELLKLKGFRKVEIKKDLFNNYRMIKAIF